MTLSFGGRLFTPTQTYIAGGNWDNSIKQTQIAVQDITTTSSPVTQYTVPAGKVFYLTQCTLKTSSGGTAHSFYILKGGTNVFGTGVTSTGATYYFRPGIKYLAGELVRTDANTSDTVYITILGILSPAGN